LRDLLLKVCFITCVRTFGLPSIIYFNTVGHMPV